MDRLPAVRYDWLALMLAAKLHKSLLTNCGVQLRLHQRQLIGFAPISRLALALVGGSCPHLPPPLRGDANVFYCGCIYFPQNHNKV